MQPGELLVVREREVEVHRLQVRPPVPTAVEDPVQRRVDDAVLVRPQDGLPGGVHPRMHAGRKEAGAERREDLVDAPHVGLEPLRQLLQRARPDRSS